MNTRKDGQARGKYTLEFELEAVRLVAETCVRAVVGHLMWSRRWH